MTRVAVLLRGMAILALTLTAADIQGIDHAQSP